MKKMYKIATYLLAFCFLLGSIPVSVKAEDYKYQVTIFSGKQGAFSGTAGLVVKGADYSVSNTADAIVIKNLNPGDTVSFEARSGAVALDKDSKYYVQGIRISGRDNNAAVENSSFEVTGDQEYVVAYGIKGNQVAYTINYQDANGNKLADSQTFYGNVGDKPVVAYTYIDGYTPEYRNLTKTLSANAAENVFTFNYLPYETVTVTTPGQTDHHQHNTTGQTVTVPGGTTTTTGGTAGGTTGTTSGTGTNANGGNAAGTTTGNGDAQGTDATGGTGNGGPGNGTDDQATAGTDNAGTNQDAQGNEDTTTIGDEETPKADQDLKDLDDEDVPKSDKDLDGNKKVKKSLPLVAGVGIGVAALAALAAGAVILKKRVRR